MVVGTGPIGLSTIMGAQPYTPREIIAVDPGDTRREWAVHLGAHRAVAPEEAADLLDERTQGLGADVVVEAVGTPEAFELCTELVRPGGHVANVGVHGAPATLHLEALWIKDVTITTGLVDTFSIPTLLSLIEVGRIEPLQLTTHRFEMADVMGAYDTFAHAAATNAVKVTLAA